MRHTLLKSYLFCFLFLFFITGFILIFCLSTPEKIRPRILDKSVTDRILVGDLVLREGNSSQSQVISLFSGSPYSHIGIITSVGDVISVTHASNDEETNEAVCETTLNEFLSKNLALRARIIRLNNLPVDVREKIASNAKQKIGMKFHLVSDNMQGSEKRLYCTTLIYDAIRQEIPEFSLMWTSINMPPFKGAFLMPASFLETDHEIIYSFE